MYRRHHRLALNVSHFVKHDANKILVSLDHLWWRIRNKLEAYMEVATSEVHHLQASFSALSDYEKCDSGFEDLLKSYASSTAQMQKGQRKLRVTWREVSNLLGELSSVIRDGDAFGSFFKAEGCKSPLAKQTLQQERPSK